MDDEHSLIKQIIKKKKRKKFKTGGHIHVKINAYRMEPPQAKRCSIT